MRTLFFLFCGCLSGSLLMAQTAETFIGDWSTTFGTIANRVAADPNDPLRFYALLDARKLQGDLEYYSVLAKYNCEGQFHWVRGLDGGDSTRQTIDMEVHPGSGMVGVLHADDTHFILQWVRPNGMPLRTVEIERSTDWQPLSLAAHPTQPRWYLLYRDNSGVLGHFGLMVIEESGNLRAGWQSDRVAFGEAQLGVLPDGRALLGASGRMYSIDPGSGEVEGWSWSGPDPLNIDFVVRGDRGYFLEVDGTGLRLIRWSANGPEEQWTSTPFPAPAFNSSLSVNDTHWAVMADVQINNSGAPVGVLWGPREQDFSSFWQPDLQALGSIQGDIALDDDLRVLYSGSTINQQADRVARLDANNPCVESSAPGDGMTSGPPQNISAIPVFNLLSLSPNIQEVPTVFYNDIPPEDRTCRSFLTRSDLAEVFRDTLVRCVDSLVLNHPFSTGVENNSEPLPQPWVIRSPGSYTVSAPVCQRSESFTFTVDFEDCGCQWFMPNVFSPNGDGINDDFGPEGECQVTDYELQIFDRWGQSVFLSRNRDQRWNGRVRGTPAANGVYVYRWRYRLLETGEWVETSGSVTIVR